MVQTEINDVKELLRVVNVDDFVDSNAKRISSRLYLLAVAKSKGQVLPKHLKGEFEDGKTEVTDKIKSINGMRSELKEMSGNNLFENVGSEGRGVYEVTEIGELVFNKYIQSLDYASILYNIRARRAYNKSKILSETDRWIQNPGDHPEFAEQITEMDNPSPTSGLLGSLWKEEKQLEEERTIAFSFKKKLEMYLHKTETGINKFEAGGESESLNDLPEEQSSNLKPYLEDCLDILGHSIEARNIEVQIKGDEEEVKASDIRAMKAELKTHQGFSDKEAEKALRTMMGYLEFKETESSDLENNLF